MFDGVVNKQIRYTPHAAASKLGGTRPRCCQVHVGQPHAPEHQRPAPKPCRRMLGPAHICCDFTRSSIRHARLVMYANIMNDDDARRRTCRSLLLLHLLLHHQHAAAAAGKKKPCRHRNNNPVRRTKDQQGACHTQSCLRSPSSHLCSYAPAPKTRLQHPFLTAAMDHPPLPLWQRRPSSRFGCQWAVRIKSTPPSSPQYALPPERACITHASV